MPSKSRKSNDESLNERFSLAALMVILLVTNVAFFVTVMPYQ